SPTPLLAGCPSSVGLQDLPLSSLAPGLLGTDPRQVLRPVRTEVAIPDLDVIRAEIVVPERDLLASGALLAPFAALHGGQCRPAHRPRQAPAVPLAHVLKNVSRA